MKSYPEFATQDIPTLIWKTTRVSMSESGYKIRNKEGIHFVTFAVVDWVDVFTRKEYKDILIESLKHCQRERGLLIYSWCIMSNHVHLVVSAKQNDTSDVSTLVLASR